MNEWMPIESAPKGPEVLVYATERGRTDGITPLPAYIGQCAWHPDAGWCVCEVREVTHWMPLPPPPHSNPQVEGE
jgi:hypothetical protein